MMHEDIERVLLTAEDIDRAVRRIGEQISRDYKWKNLMVVGVLKGSVVFMADLIRHITVPLRMDFLAISSYGGGAKSSGVVRILKDLEYPIEGYDVLIVEDILDSGLTLSYIADMLEARNPASIRICTLLNKPERRRVRVEPDYEGYKVPDEFVVGYGLDYNECYRNLPYIGILKRSVYEG